MVPPFLLRDIDWIGHSIIKGKFITEWNSNEVIFLMPWKRKVLTASGVCIGVGSSIFIAQRQWERLNRVTWTDIPPPNFTIDSREQQIKALQQGEEYDVLVIGGGATGTGVALDAATRKLKVALVEKDDFGSGWKGLG